MFLDVAGTFLERAGTDDDVVDLGHGAFLLARGVQRVAGWVLPKTNPPRRRSSCRGAGSGPASRRRVAPPGGRQCMVAGRDVWILTEINAGRPGCRSRCRRAGLRADPAQAADRAPGGGGIHAARDDCATSHRAAPLRIDAAAHSPCAAPQPPGTAAMDHTPARPKIAETVIHPRACGCARPPSGAAARCWNDPRWNTRPSATIRTWAMTARSRMPRSGSSAPSRPCADRPAGPPDGTPCAAPLHLLPGILRRGAAARRGLLRTPPRGAHGDRP